MRFPKTVFCAGLLSLVPVICVAQAPTEIEAVLALPASPGSDALLLPHAADPRVPQRWREALKDPSVARRTAAARLIGAAAARTTIGGLRAAALEEKDPTALAEMLRSLIIIGSDVTDVLVFERLGDVPPLAAQRIADVLATVRPAGVVSHLLAGGHLAGSADRVADIYARVLAVAPQEATRLEQGAPGANPQVMAGMLRMARTTDRRLPGAVLVAALHADAEAAGDALSYLAATYEKPSKAAADTALMDAHAAYRSTQQPASPLHGLLLALAERWVARGRTDVSAAVGAVDVGAFKALQLAPEALAVLTRDERHSLDARLGRTSDTKPPAPVAALEEFVETGRWRSGILAPVLLMTDLPSTLVLDLATVTGCRASGDDVFGATITQRSDGRVESATLGAASLSEACLRMGRILVSAAYGPPPLPKTIPARTLIRLDEAWWSCIANSDSGPAPTRLWRRDVAPPRKILDRKPYYPAEAQSRNIQGVVVVDATITSAGCVSDARIMRSIPPLDLHALAAVSHWRYEPMVIEGAPGPVRLTLTLNFMLR